MNVKQLLSAIGPARKALLVFAVTVAVSLHTGHAAGQSVSLVMEEAALQRACAAIAIANASAEAKRQSEGTTTPRRCRVAVVTPRDEVWRTIALVFALAVLAGSLWMCAKGPRRQ